MAREWREERRRTAEEVARLQSGGIPAPSEGPAKRVSDTEFFTMSGIGEA